MIDYPRVIGSKSGIPDNKSTAFSAATSKNPGITYSSLANTPLRFGIIYLGVSYHMITQLIGIAY